LQRQFDVVIERDEDGYYVASVPQLPGCHTQGRSLDEVTLRIREAIELCLESRALPPRTLNLSVSNALQLRHEPEPAPSWHRIGQCPKKRRLRRRPD
jgi:predicted RNase H-like HicB family nuclease